jgi:hypothetical protein
MWSKRTKVYLKTLFKEGPFIRLFYAFLQDSQTNAHRTIGAAVSTQSTKIDLSNISSTDIKINSPVET